MINTLKSFFSMQQTHSPAHTFRIVAVDDSYHHTGKVYVKVQVVGKSQVFNRAVSELYQKEWLQQFSHEDVAHIAALFTAEQTNNLPIIEKFPKCNTAHKASVMIVGILFTAFLILSNLTAFKLASVGPLIFPAGLIFFPLTYIFDDILTEVYGFKVSRRVIWTALLANSIVFLGCWLTTLLPPAVNWAYQSVYEIIYSAAPRIFFASMIGYICGEFANSILIAKLKVFMHGKHLWFRALASSAVGLFIDSILFLHIAYWLVVPYGELWHIIFTMYSVKVIYEACALPLTYKISAYLKARDNVDHYDFQTKFNPFSLAV